MLFGSSRVCGWHQEMPKEDIPGDSLCPFWDDYCMWPFQRLSDLQLGDQKVTLNHLLDVFILLHMYLSYRQLLTNTMYTYLHTCCDLLWVKSQPKYSRCDWKRNWVQIFQLRIPLSQPRPPLSWPTTGPPPTPFPLLQAQGLRSWKTLGFRRL